MKSKFSVLGERQFKGGLWDIETENRLFFFENYEGRKSDDSTIFMEHKSTGGYAMWFEGLPPKVGDIIYIFDVRDFYRVDQLLGNNRLKLVIEGST